MVLMARNGGHQQDSNRIRMGLGLAVLIGLAILLWPFLNWAVFDAYWIGDGPRACPDKSGACWPFIQERLGQILYGAYPEPERWRIHVGFGIGLLIVVALVWLPFRRKAIWAPPSTSPRDAILVSEG